MVESHKLIAGLSDIALSERVVPPSQAGGKSSQLLVCEIRTKCLRVCQLRQIAAQVETIKVPTK